MRLNKALLSSSEQKTLGTRGTLGTTSNDAAFSVPKGLNILGTDGNTDYGGAILFPMFPNAKPILGTLKPSNGAVFPDVPNVPKQKATICFKSLLAANDERPQGGELLANRLNDPRTRARQAIVTRPLIVLTYEIDGRCATCIDSVSASLEEAVGDLRDQYRGRVGRIWCKNIEIFFENMY